LWTISSQYGNIAKFIIKKNIGWKVASQILEMEKQSTSKSFTIQKKLEILALQNKNDSR
jgi:hypothetical protein